jgi:SAM-dependent methyltransferase
MVSRIGKRWDKVTEAPPRNWWHSEKCRSYLNAAISSTPGSLGPISAIRQAFPGRVFGRAVSVGCGTGAKEISYLTEGLVASFDLWDLAEGRLQLAKKAGLDRGVGDRIEIHCGNAFASSQRRYDLVHWDHSLHHMSDVAAALSWSRAVTNEGGIIVINDYVGPTRLQWTRREVAAANEFLAAIGSPERISESTMISRLRMWLRDSSEAPQSDRICGAVEQMGHRLRPIGGTLLNILGSVVVSRHDDEDPQIDALIDADRRCRLDGLSHFAFGILD